ncbi:alcohol oxidase [Mycena crocata]|nr:alcohol oxidase [Mycena crocata]
MSSAESFDYVVIGAGTGGLAVAVRLCEDPAVSVCVLEAGEDVTKELDAIVPGFGFKNLGQPKVDWGHMTTPQANAKDRSIYLPRGKSLGGSSMLNLMTLNRAHEVEYNAIETLGSPGWDWKGLLEYFRKSETFVASPEEQTKYQVDFNPSTHGTSGPIHRTLPKWTSDVQTPFIEGMSHLGVPWNRDASSGNNFGLWTSNHSIDGDGARVSSASAYYEPNKSNPNLVVVAGAHATRIMLNSSADASGNLVASGVEYIKDGKSLTVSARKEVLVCAGAFKSPQLLELSGIGDKKVLDAHGIDVKLDLPAVGTNLRSHPILQDHFWSPFVTETDPKYESAEVLGDPARAAKEWKIYEESKTGMLSGTCSTLYAFLAKKYYMEEGYKIPEQMSTSLHPTLANLQKGWLNADEAPFLEITLFPGFLPVVGHSPEPGKSYFSVFLCLTHPFSSGTVHIASADPLAPPAIDYHVLDNQVDVDLLVRGIRFARKLVATPSLKDVVARELLPGPAVQTDEEIADFIRGTVSTVFHPLGTTPMLPRKDGGVVDASLKVYGTANIRVVDASIIPIQMSAHTQATVYAIAEKAADILKREHGSK